jgi:pimeloyl-ACP methyl ester carboxylesterase
MRTHLVSAFFVVTLFSSMVCAQAVDTFIDVGGYPLRFHIIKGRGIPILFESGGGDDAAVWKDVLKPIADLTGATLITYDRRGFGRSEIDPNMHGIVNDVRALETALDELGYRGDLMLVAHSLGGFYATLYAARNAHEVKSAVLIDANEICFFTDEQANKMKNSAAELEKLKHQAPGRYYLALDFEDIISIMRRTPFPRDIPLLDIVAEQTQFDGTPDAERWHACHRKFVAASPQRRGLTAYGSGHYVFISNPELVIAAIVARYSRVADPAHRLEVLNRAAEYGVDAANSARRREVNYRHSEDDLNSWGYALLHQNEPHKALEVFRLNTTLYPGSWNAHDSLAEAYEELGDRDQARKHYERAVELNPQARHARERLDVLATGDRP